MEIIGLVASILGIVAFFAVSPSDLAGNLRKWFLSPADNFSKRRNKLSVHELFCALRIEDVAIENVFYDNPLPFERFDSKVVPYEGGLPTNLRYLKSQEVAERRQSAAKDGITLDNNGSFALRRIDVSRPEGSRGRRNNYYTLILEPTDYYSFVFPNLCLDKHYYNQRTQEHHALRESLELPKEGLSISNLQYHMELQFKLGTGTLLVTKDGYLICSVRSGAQFVAGKQSRNELAVHISSAEGMYRSENALELSDCLENGRPSPFATSARSLIDELNLSSRDVDLDEILCLGYFLDLKRAQPFFLFILNSQLTAKEFFSRYSDVSADAHENDAIFALPKNFSNLIKLFNGCSFSELQAIYPEQHSGFFKLNNSSRVRIASNHAQVGFAIFALRELGPITNQMLKQSK